MDGIRLFTLAFSVTAHLAAGWLLYTHVSGMSIDAGSGTDQFRIENGIAIESVITFGDAPVTAVEAVESQPVLQPVAEQIEPEKPDAPKAITTAAADAPVEALTMKETEPVEERTTEPVQETKPQPVQVAELEQQAGSASQSGGHATIVSAYYGSATRALQRHRVNPRSRLTGVVVVRFTLEPSGKLISREIESSSGSKLLDDAALASVDRASPFPPVPPNVPLVFSVPFNFSTR